MTQYQRREATPNQTIIVLIYLMISTVALVYSMIKFWPYEPLLGNSTSVVTYLNSRFDIHDEIRLLLLVTFAGGLGGMVHALRSFVWYVGNQDLESNWIPMYILTPFIGTVIGLVFYIVIRGGFYSPETITKEPNLFVFVALACITGMFTEQAIMKLKEISEAILTKPETGKDKDKKNNTEKENPGN